MYLETIVDVIREGRGGEPVGESGTLGLHVPAREKFQLATVEVGSNQF